MIEIPEKLLPVFLNDDNIIKLGDADFRGASGGRGSGKTVSFVKVAAYLGAAQRLNIAFARYFQASIQTGLFAELKCVIQTEKSDFLRNNYIVGKNYVEGKNGTHFLFKGLARNIHELKGDAKLSIVLIDEAEKVPKEAWQTIIPTIREANSELWACWNPQDEDSEVHKIFIANGKDDPRVRHAECNWRDNFWFSEKSNRDRLRHLENDPATYNHIWEGEFLVLSDAQILSGAWDVQEFTPDWSYGQPLFGADFGFSQDPSTLIKCYIRDDYLFISDEAYRQGVELDDMPAFYDTIDQSRTGKIYGDCSRPETISHIKRNGFRIASCSKWAGSVEDGIAHLRGAYKKIIIHPRCKNTIRECRYYQYKIDDRTGRITSTIVDKDNHCLIAGTLITTTRGDIPIEQLTTSDYVLTRQGYKKVLFAGITGVNMPVFSVSQGGNSVVCTDNHKIYLSNKKGFFVIDAMSYNDSLLMLKGQLLWKHKLYLMVKNIIAILTQKNGTQAKMALKSMERLAQLLTLNLCQYLKNANNATPTFLQKNLDALINFALTGVSRQTGEIAGKIALKKTVQFVLKFLCVQNTREQRLVVENAGIALVVYDVTVEDTHEFFANGILVHNCIDALRYALNDKIKRLNKGSF